jgi:hypothetical protein
VTFWPRDTIRELLAQAEAEGSARAELPSAREAELFRFAIYNFRKQERIGQSIKINLNDNVVEFHSTPSVKIINETQEVEG